VQPRRQSTSPATTRAVPNPDRQLRERRQLRIRALPADPANAEDNEQQDRTRNLPAVQGMAMMDPSSWNGQEHSLPPPAEDDFQQFLEMGDMSSLGDGLQFDFQAFNTSNGGPMLHSQAAHDVLDTQMSGTETTPVDSRGNMGMQNQIPITSAPGAPSVPSQVMSPHIGNNANDAISEIDAQIQFLQHQKIQQQHRQLEEQQRRFQEQQAAFYAQQQRSMVPPTPQSLEMQASTQYYTQGEQTSHHSQGMFDRYPRLKDQHDVRLSPARLSDVR
jgi:hypothetical protein